MKASFLSLCLLFFTFSGMAKDTSWPDVTAEMKPGTRWWWLGSAVDQGNLTYNLQEYAAAGMGAVEITPIYGVQGNDANNIPYLSDQWMEMLKHTQAETKRLGIFTDMNTGTGWPFGGPEVSVEAAASKLLHQSRKKKGGEIFAELIRSTEKNQQSAKLLRLMAFSGRKVVNLTSKVDTNGKIRWKVPAGNWEIIAVFNGKTFQKVKRAAPGGEGYVIDHFSKKAVSAYFDKFDQAFKRTGTPYPHHFFNDSYEVYGADWTEDLFEQFELRRGYKLENYLPQFLSTERTEANARLVADYRETISDLLLGNFTQLWTSWANERGSKTRNQAHGSPGNLIDLYGAVDVPECEGFGLSNFNIPGLRKDSLTRRNDSDLSMLKYASSAAHIAGKPYTSAESFTWLTEHFRTSLSQCKPDLDLMFVSGVNHMNFHGTPYSPKEAAWPGWLFYASVNMSPTNTIWRDAPAMFSYITRCQSFLQFGQPDNDFLMYLPVYDVWHEQKGRLLQFDIHSMEKRMPEFIHAVHAVYENGFDLDYISDRFILTTQVVDKKLVTQGGAVYKSLILPSVKIIPDQVLKHILKLAEQGATIIFLDRIPADVPGFAKYQQRTKQRASLLKKLPFGKDFTKVVQTDFRAGRIITGSDYNQTLLSTGYRNEEMITVHGLHLIRRKHADGHHYFVSCLQDKAVDGWVKLAVQAKSVLFFDPMTGVTGKAESITRNGVTEVFLQLNPGESIILKTFTDKDVEHPSWKYLKNMQTVNIQFDAWNLQFAHSEPAINDMFVMRSPASWTTLSDQRLRINRGTGVYSSSFELKKQKEAEYMLDLGDVRESARVILNNRPVTTLWAVPFKCRVTDDLQDGVNTIRIEVTNLPANSIAAYDRDKVNWRIFNEINMVDIAYRKSDYSKWLIMESGLNSPLKLMMYPR